jgi:hypothetical protein
MAPKSGLDPPSSGLDPSSDASKSPGDCKGTSISEARVNVFEPRTEVPRAKTSAHLSDDVVLV